MERCRNGHQNTRNTGNLVNEHTIDVPDRID
jgi:hypothetical protein